MKVVINRCFGGFSLSQKLYDELGIEYDGFGYISNGDLGIVDEDEDAYRIDQRLISAILKIGVDTASGELADLEVVEIPDSIEWQIDEYDELESIHEPHRSW